MAKKQKSWVFVPSKASKPKVSPTEKTAVQARANQVVETILKPKHIKPMPEDYQFNYLVDIYTKWYQHYFYFCAKYHAHGPNAISPEFEVKFARLEYVANDRYNLAYMRHTGQRWELGQNLSLETCLTAIQNQPEFMP